MPWEKSFDLDTATEAAIKVFWAKGYEATSIADLVNSMGINKGSLYNAFGSKKELFTRALLQYDRNNRQKSLRALEALDDPVGSIRILFDGLIVESEADTDRKGCLLVNTALDLPNQEGDVQVMVTSALEEFQDFFRRAVVLGRKRGGIPKTVDPDETAKSLLALVVGLRVLARGVFNGVGLRAIRNQALKLLKG